MDVLVVDWFVQQIIETEAASYDQHEALVKFGCDLEERLIVVLQLQAVVLDIIDHPHLLLIEEFPHFQYIFKMLSGYLVKMALLSRQLFLILLF